MITQNNNVELPHYIIDPPEHLRRDTMEQWRNLRSKFFSATGLNGDFADSRLKATVYRVDNLIVAEACGHNLLCVRNRRHLQTDLSGFVELLSIHEKSSNPAEVVRFNGPSQGSLMLNDYSRSLTSIYNGQRQLKILFPHSAIGYKRDCMPAKIGIDRDGTIGRILHSVLSTLSIELPNAKSEDAEAIALSLSSLVRGLLAGGASSDTEKLIQNARAQSMRDYLEQNLRDPDIGTTALGNAFGASRATIYRDFAKYGGVANYIKNRRLERAFVELTEAGRTLGSVTKVSERWAFASLYQFSRAFRNHFGVTPSSVVGVSTEIGFEDRSVDCQVGQVDRVPRRDPTNLELWLSHLGSK